IAPLAGGIGARAVDHFDRRPTGDDRHQEESHKSAGDESEAVFLLARKLARLVGLPSGGRGLLGRNCRVREHRAVSAIHAAQFSGGFARMPKEAAALNALLVTCNKSFTGVYRRRANARIEKPMT